MEFLRQLLRWLQESDMGLDVYVLAVTAAENFMAVTTLSSGFSLGTIRPVIFGNVIALAYVILRYFTPHE